MRILVDQDGVLAQWHERMLELYNKEYGISFTPDQISRWKFSENFPGSRDHIPIDYRKFYRELEPVPGAIEGMRELVRAGHDVTIATAVSHEAPESYVGKVEWVKNHLPFLHPKHVIAVTRKELLEGDILLDDGPHNIVAWDEARRQAEDYGACAVVFDRFWNSRKHYPELAGHHRIRNWTDFLEFVREMGSIDDPLRRRR